MARVNAAKSSAQKIDDHWKFTIKYNKNNLKKNHDRQTNKYFVSQ